MRLRTGVSASFLLFSVVNLYGAEDPALAKAKAEIKAQTQRLEDLLRNGRVTQTFEKKGLPAAISLLKEKFKLDVVVDPVAHVEERTVPVEEEKNISLDSAFKLLCGGDLCHEVRGEALFITTAAAMAKMKGREFVEPEKPSDAQKKMLLALYQVRAGMQLEAKPVKDALAFLEGKGGVKIRIEPANAADDMTVTVSVKEASLRSLLDLVCGSRLAWDMAEDSILVGLPDTVREQRAKREAAKATAGPDKDAKTEPPKPAAGPEKDAKKEPPKAAKDAPAKAPGK